MDDRSDADDGLQSCRTTINDKKNFMEEKNEESSHESVEKEISGASKVCGHEQRDSAKEQSTTRKELVILMYQSLEQLLKSEEFDNDLKKVLEKSNPKYLHLLEKRRRDIEKSDHGIVIAGETSAGKSTLINKVLGKRIFMSRNLESTSTICKIRNSEKVQIIIEYASGETEVKDLTDECDPNTKEGQKLLRDTLKGLTDMISSEESKAYRSVDVGLPIPFLKGDTILVDTPGIGGSGEVSQKLMDYLPNALSFIFVINVASAGGMQRDRLPEILRSLIALQIDNEMPCFDPKDVIFITNKWDTISRGESDSEEEDEVALTWKTIQSEIKSRWPAVMEKNIFKLSLKEVSPEKSNTSVEQFREFQKVLSYNLDKAEHARVIEHLRFLQELLENILKVLHARLELNKKSDEEQIALTEKHNKKIEALKEECEEVKKKLGSRITVHIDKTAETSYTYMSSSIGRTAILNPKGRKSILSICSDAEACVKEVERRFTLYLDDYLKSEDVVVEFKNIQKDVESFYKETTMTLYVMETEWTTASVMGKSISTTSPRELTPFEVAAAFILFPLAAPLLLVVAIGITILLAPFQAIWNFFRDIEGEKRNAIDKAYEECRTTVRVTIRKELNTNAGSVLTKLVHKVTVDVLPRRIDALEEMIFQLKILRSEILAKSNSLKDLERKIKAMKGDVCKLQEELKEN